MNSLFPRASLKRSVRTRTRKNSISATTETVHAHPHSSILTRRKTRPPPLQIIPELSENVLDICACSPSTARPMQFAAQQPVLEPSRITLSAYTFSIDDALLMIGDDAPRSPALSVSSSTSDGASSESILATPGSSDDENGHFFMLPTPRLRPHRISIRPLCITKTRSLICKEDEDIHNCFEEDGKNAIILPTAGEHLERGAIEIVEESEQDFYAREFEDFICFSPVIPSPSSPARRDSLVLVFEAVPTALRASEQKPRGRSRHSKPLPLLPPVTPPMSTFPLALKFPQVPKNAQKSIVRQKFDTPSYPSYPPSSPPAKCRPLPRMSVPLDIEDGIFSEDDQLEESSCEPVIIPQINDTEDGTSIYSQRSFVRVASTSTCLLPPAIPETPLSGMYGEMTLPRSSTDSDAPRSSVDSNTSFTSSSSVNTPSSPFCEDDELESSQRLCSRWSTSTLGSLAEPPRTTTLLSPLKSVLNTRVCRGPTQKVPTQIPFQLTPPKPPRSKHCTPTTPSPSNTLGKHIRRQESPSSTSSARSSEYIGFDGSPSGSKRKPIAMLTFLRATQT